MASDSYELSISDAISLTVVSSCDTHDLFFLKTILLVTKDLVVLKEVHQVTMYDLFESFGVNISMSVIVCNWVKNSSVTRQIRTYILW